MDPRELLALAPEWHRDALCREYPDVNWFPERGESSTPAKEVCARCLVREQCLDDALVQGTEHGIWGGLGGRTRRKLRIERGYLVVRRDRRKAA